MSHLVHYTYIASTAYLFADGWILMTKMPTSRRRANQTKRTIYSN